MKLNLHQTLTGFDGQPLKDGDKTLDLKGAALIALKTVAPGDEHLAPLAKYDLGVIGAAIAKGLDLTTEQVAALKDRIGKVFLSPELVHAAWDAIEGKTEVANG